MQGVRRDQGLGCGWWWVGWGGEGTLKLEKALGGCKGSEGVRGVGRDSGGRMHRVGARGRRGSLLGDV